MIAPIRQSHGGDGSSTTPLTSARRAVAQVLFERDADRRPAAPPVPGWLAWLFVGWVAMAAAVYIYRFGSWKISAY